MTHPFFRIHRRLITIFLAAVFLLAQWTTFSTYELCAAEIVPLLNQPLQPLPATTSAGFDPEAFNASMAASAARLLADGKLKSLVALSDAKLGAMSLSLPAPAAEKLDPADLHDKLMASTAVVGLYYLCHHCDHWHFEIGAGFAVARGGILSTCGHMMEFRPTDMREAYPIAVDAKGTVYPIVEVIAFDSVADTCLVRAEGADFPPLPLRTGGRAGESLYCLSHPGENYFMFTSGMVSRMEVETKEQRPVRFVNVTCDYSPGSSGGPITDSSGNVVAQVATIQPQLLQNNSGRKNAPAATVYNLRTAIAADEIIRLFNPANRLPFPHPAGDTPQTKAAAPPVTSASPGNSGSTAGFNVTTQYDLVEAPSSVALDQQVKSFDELYALTLDQTRKLKRWNRDSKPNQAHQLNTDSFGFTGNTGYYKPTDASEEMLPRGVEFDITYRDLKEDNSVTAQIAVNDTRYTPKAADNLFKVEATVKPKSFQLVRLGAPQKDRQAWLALMVEDFERGQKSPSVPEMKFPKDEPIDIKFTALDGRLVETEKMRGKVVLIDFWATWCGPCLKAAPRLAELYAQYHDQGLEVIGISLDQDRGALEKYLKKNAHPWPQYFSEGTAANPLAARFGVDAIPAFLLIDKQGLGTTLDIRNPDADDLIKARLK